MTCQTAYPGGYTQVMFEHDSSMFDGGGSATGKSEPPTYLVVGGVAGGMSAAARLRRRDESATIIVLEKGRFVSFANCGLPYFVSGEIEKEAELLVQTPRSLAAWLNLDVRVNHEVVGLDPARRSVTVRTEEGLQQIDYDALVLAPGVVAARPPIPGLDHPVVRTLRTVDDALALRSAAMAKARRAVVLGAGFIGLEAAEALASRGLAVAVVEYAPHVLPPLEKELAWLVAEELRRLGVDLYEGVAAAEILDQPAGEGGGVTGRVLVRLADDRELVADLVVLATGTAPATAVFEAAGLACERGSILVDDHGRTNLPRVYAVGDATLSLDGVTGERRPVQLAGPANRAGRYVADALVADQAGLRAGGPGDGDAGDDAGGAPAVAGPRQARPVPRPLGTAIVRVGALTAAMTGANRAALDRAGRAYATVHTHPGSHAGYFPGSKQMHLVVHLDPATGEILGAQGVGADGVDKRIDLLATAIRAGIDAPGLIDLDLAYSPPYGSAKDPVTMVGFLADNLLTGQTRLWRPEDLDWARSQAVLLLDVRTPAEFASGHLPEAVNIAHTELRGRLDEVRRLAAGRPVAVMCQSGVRSYIAHRILVAAGFDSATLSGGMLTLRAWLGAEAGKVLV